MYLHEKNLIPAANFLNSPLWQDFKRALIARKPAAADPAELPHAAAARAFKRDGWDETIAMIEALPFDIAPAEVKHPFDRPALDPRD